MNTNEVKSLVECMQKLESEGAMVIMPEPLQNKIDKHFIKLDKDRFKQEQKEASEWENQKKEAFEDATDAFEKGADLGTIEDIFHAHGLEPDYIEDWINSYS